MKLAAAIVCIILTNVLVPFGQYFWKKSLIAGFKINILYSANFLLGCLFFVTGTVVWLYALSLYPLSKIYPFLSFSFLIGILIGVIILGEKFTFINFVGSALLVVSLILISIKS
jgi:drug/metabolite transporter (DMT)-like permease